LPRFSASTRRSSAFSRCPRSRDCLPPRNSRVDRTVLLRPWCLRCGRSSMSPGTGSFLDRGRFLGPHYRFCSPLVSAFLSSYWKACRGPNRVLMGELDRPRDPGGCDDCRSQSRSSRRRPVVHSRKDASYRVEQTQVSSEAWCQHCALPTDQEGPSLLDIWSGFTAQAIPALGSDLERPFSESTV